MKVIISTIIAISFFLLSCTPKPAPAQLDPTRTDELFTIATTLTQYMNEGNQAAALALMDTNMQKAMQGKLTDTWGSLVKQSGAFIESTTYKGLQSSGYDIIEHTLVFQRGTIIQRTVFNSENLIAGLFFKPGKVDTTTPDIPKGITEETVTVDSGTGYPLEALLTLPAKRARVAVVLVHGSGPSDKDETIGANKPFSDIAYGLAEKGIAVLRYHKRTFAHRAKIIEDKDAAARLTIFDEVIEDAVAAYNLLKPRFERVYVLGHSISGALLAEINAKGAGYNGYIIMAGTPQKLYELSAEQNLLYADELEANGDTHTAQQIRAFVPQELAKSSRLARMSDADALKEENAMFTVSAWYLRSLEGIDPIKQHLADGKPVLVLQGGRDRQVTIKAYNMWQTGLIAHPNATFKLYPALNHLMGNYQGEEVPFAQLISKEYAQSTPVATEVIKDIAQWVIDS